MVKKRISIIALCLITTAAIIGCSIGGKQSEQKMTSVEQTKTAVISDKQIKSDSGNTDHNTDNSKSEKPVAPEKNPPGDIPDTQVFVKYSSDTGGYDLQSPEGWARTENGSDVKFVDKFDGINVKISEMTDKFTIDYIKNNQVSNIEKSGRAVKVKDIKQVKLKGGNAIIVYYDSNSEPDSVTTKQIRLENESIFFYNNWKLAEIVLWAPLGADNVDQWNLISNSFKWKQ